MTTYMKSGYMTWVGTLASGASRPEIDWAGGGHSNALIAYRPDSFICKPWNLECLSITAAMAHPRNERYPPGVSSRPLTHRDEHDDRMYDDEPRSRSPGKLLPARAMMRKGIHQDIWRWDLPFRTSMFAEIHLSRSEGYGPSSLATSKTAK